MKILAVTGIAGLLVIVAAHGEIETMRRQIVHCSKADLEYGAGVAKALGIKATPAMIAAE
jgi:catalase